MTTPTALQPDPEQAAAYLAQWFPPGHLLALTAIREGAATVTQTFDPREERRAMAAFIADHNDRRYNCYFHINPVQERVAKKATKGDIRALAYLHADLDPEPGADLAAERVRLLATVEAVQPPAHVIVDSGGGLQAFWRLSELLALTEATTPALEGYSRTLGALLGADAVHNVDRLMRVPFTINHPNKKKRDRGRVPALATVVRNDAGATVRLDQVPRFPDRFLDLLKLDLVLKARWQGGTDELDDVTRSGRDLSLVGKLKARGFAEAEARTVWRHWPHGKGPHGGTERDFDRCWANTKAEPIPEAAPARGEEADAALAELNQSYALVLVGDKPAVLKEGRTPEGRPDLRLMGVGALKEWFRPRRVTVRMRDKDGERIRGVSLADYWLNSPLRRQYEGILFAPQQEVPGYLNLWRGFAVTPSAEGSCDLFLAHLRDNVFQGNADHYAWGLGWLADVFQHPATKPGTSLVLRGPRGVGKTFVGETVGALLGGHYALVSDPRYITGRFNAHMIDCVVLHTDEGFWAGDKAAEGRLKDLVTGGHHFIEFKGKEPIRVANYVRLMVTGNEHWLVPAGPEERRWAVFDVGTARQQDHQYFGAIADELRRGGYAKLLHTLLHVDLSRINLRRTPHTDALIEQQFASLTPEEAWLLDVLTRGTLPGDTTGEGRSPAPLLYQDFLSHAQKVGVRRRSLETQLGRFLRTVFKSQLRKPEGSYLDPSDRYQMTRRRCSIYEFPPLAEARALFGRTLGFTAPWDGPETWLAQDDPDL